MLGSPVSLSGVVGFHLVECDKPRAVERPAYCQLQLVNET